MLDGALGQLQFVNCVCPILARYSVPHLSNLSANGTLPSQSAVTAARLHEILIRLLSSRSAWSGVLWCLAQPRRRYKNSIRPTTYQNFDNVIIHVCLDMMSLWIRMSRFAVAVGLLGTGENFCYLFDSSLRTDLFT